MTRSMVRQALNELEKDGLIKKRQGKGSIVERKDQRLGLLSFRGFTEVLGGSHHQVHSRFLQPVKLLAWDDHFFFDLNDEERKHACVVIKRLREIDGQPVMLEHTYFPDVLDNFLEQKWVEASLFKTLQAYYQVSMSSVEQYIRATTADPHGAALLNLQEAAPLLKINRKYATSRSGFYIYSTLYCNTQDYAIGSYLE